MSVGLNPHESALFLNSGLVYQGISDRGHSLHFLKIPLGMDLGVGRKLKFIFGGGIYVSYLFNTPGRDSTYHQKYRDFQIGPYFDIGLRYLLTNKWCIFLKSQMEFDLTPLYLKDRDIEYYSYDFGIVIGTRYLIPSKEKKN